MQNLTRMTKIKAIKIK